MKKIFFKEAIAIVLVCVLMFIVPAQALAQSDSNTLYISDIVVASGKDYAETRSELFDKDYNVFDYDVNAGTGKDLVFIGYKTTTDPKEAITDLRIMDMNGGYSISNYQNGLKNYEEQVAKQLNEYKSSIEEFRELYKDNDEKAVYVYKQLNKFKEDDSGKLIGDLFIANELDMATLTKVFVQGNADAVRAIEQLFAIVFSDEWLQDAAANTANDYNGATDLDQACALLIDSWDDLQNGLYKYHSQLNTEEGYDMSKYTEESFTQWYEKSETNKANGTNVLIYGTIYLILSEQKTANGGTLLDTFLKTKENLTYNDLYPIADALTAGALQAMQFVGLTFTVECNDLDVAELEKSNQENKEDLEEMAVQYVNSEAKTEKEKITTVDLDAVVSVYDGVDRSVFDKNSGIALTSEANRSKASTKDDTFAQIMRKNTIYAAMTGMVAGVVVCAVGAGIIFHAMSLYGEPICLKPAMLPGKIVAGVGVGIIVASAAIALIISLVEYYHPEYLVVPRGMVDKVEKKQYDKDGKLVSSTAEYIMYYAALDTEDSGSGNRKFGDLNGWAGRQWNALYYTKDGRAGDPITTDCLVKYSDSAVPDGYTPVRYFGSTECAFDLNTHAFSSDKGIYMFYKGTAGNSTVGSSFTAGYIAISAVAGIIVGGLLTALVLKKKKKPVTED